jgi:hypothetical protein
MKLKNICYGALMTLATAAFVLGSAGSSEAAKKKKAEAAPVPVICWGVNKPVCATRGGQKFTYASACYAAKDGAKVVSQKACPAKKAVKAKKGKKKAAKKPAKKPMKK